jgi:Mce-associated membrane protein
MDTAARSRRRTQIVAMALVAAIIVLVAAAGLLGNIVLRANRGQQASKDAVQAARQEAVNLVTLDHRHIDDDVRNILTGATGEFHDEYAKDATRVKQIVTTNQVRSSGSILEAGVVTSDADSATVLVVVDSMVRNKADEKGQLRHYRIQFEMSRQGTRWLARTLQFVT